MPVVSGLILEKWSTVGQKLLQKLGLSMDKINRGSTRRGKLKPWLHSPTNPTITKSEEEKNQGLSPPPPRHSLVWNVEH